MGGIDMARSFALAMVIALSLIACGKKSANPESSNWNSPAKPISPDLNPKSLEEKCLDLASIKEHFEQPGFDFPSLTYTADFEILSPSVSLVLNQRLHASTFRINTTQLRAIPDLNGLKQDGCSAVFVATLGGVDLKYNIISYGLDHLDFELDQESLAKATDHWTDIHRKTFLSLPTIHQYRIRVTDKRRFEIESTYKAVATECHKNGSLNLRELTVYAWSKAREELDGSIVLKPIYLTNLRKLLSPTEDLSQLGENPSLPIAVARSMQSDLQRRAYAACN